MQHSKIYRTAINDVQELNLIIPIYKSLEYNSKYSDTTGSLWFYFKNEAFDFSNDVVNSNGFKKCKYKAKLLKNTSVDEENTVLNDAAIAIPLEYVSNFSRSLEMALISCKVESKLKWAQDCVLTMLDNENTNTNPESNFFTIKDENLYIPVVTLLAKDH